MRLRELAAQAPQKENGKGRGGVVGGKGNGIGGSGDYSTLDIVPLCKDLGIYGRRGNTAGKHHIRCFQEDQHSTGDGENDSDTVIYEANGGWPGFKCQHQHCAGLGIREFIEHYGPEKVSQYCREEFRPKIGEKNTNETVAALLKGLKEAEPAARSPHLIFDAMPALASLETAELAKVKAECKELLGNRLNLNDFTAALTAEKTRQKQARCRQSGKQSPYDGGAVPAVTFGDFHAYMPEHQYIFTHTGEMWPAASVNARLPAVHTGKTDEDGNPKLIPPAQWLDQNQPVEQMTWAPGYPQLIEGRLIADGGWITRPGCNVFNLYRPPVVASGDVEDVLPWWDHLVKVYGEESATHIVTWSAHRVQRPGEKVNHALVLGGSQGIGKDTLLEPIKAAVGPWNFAEVTPTQILGRFNGFVKSVILRVSEARDLGDIDRYSFYEHMKLYTAAPPDVLRCDEKNRHEYYVRNICGVVITTNHRLNGLYLPEDDRRHYVAWSELTKEEFPADYWRKLWGWYAAGGLANVVAYLRAFDLTHFDPKAPPHKTDAWWMLTNSDRAAEDDELADALGVLGVPDVVSKEQILSHGQVALELKEWLRDRRNARSLPHRLERAGYVSIRNATQKDGRWKVEGKNVVLYGRKDSTERERQAAATALVGRGW